jgi:hypothetical protein
MSNLPRLFTARIALPQDHGSWIFLLTPLSVGLAAGGRLSMASAFLVLAALAAFLLRQPLTILLKVLSGRRPAVDLGPSILWSAVYMLAALAGGWGLAAGGYAPLLLLIVPGGLVFALHLYLVSRRKERKQAGVEIAATGVLALAAPAAYWIGQGEYRWMGMLLWALLWSQAAASIVHVYLRLGQRSTEALTAQDPWKEGRRALAYTSFNLGAVLLAGLYGLVPLLLFLPFLLQWLETLWGITHPAARMRPVQVGLRQLLVSVLFTILFILTWR